MNWNDGALQSAAIRLNAPQVTGAYAERKPIKINNLALNGYYQRDDEGAIVTLDSLAMNFGETRWESHVQLKQTVATDKTDELWHLQADRLDLTPITPLLNALGPLPENVATVVDHLKVTGGLRNVLLDFRPNATDGSKFGFAANLDNVGFDAITVPRRRETSVAASAATSTVASCAWTARISSCTSTRSSPSHGNTSRPMPD